MSVSYQRSSRMLKQKQLLKTPFRSHKFVYDIHDISVIQSHMSHPDRQFALLAEMGGVQGLAASFRTDVNDGLYEDEVKEGTFPKRVAEFGDNVYPQQPSKTFWEHVWDLLHDEMLIILGIAGTLSTILGAIKEPEEGWVDGVAIFVAIALVTFVGAFNNVQQDKQFRALDEGREPPVSLVKRAGVEKSIKQSELVVGDVIVLTAGDAIPVDCVMITPAPIKINAAQMTGESEDIKKNYKSPFLESGTSIREGECTAIVIATGVHTRYGRIMLTLSNERENTPLQDRLDYIAMLVGYVGGGVAVVLFLSLLIKYLIISASDDNWRNDGEDILDYFIVAVTIIVVAVPEGLPLAVTISLAYSLEQMAKEQNLVKILSACETMGNATTICSDKTGTLTQNKMTVVETYFCGTHFARRFENNQLVLGRPSLDFITPEVRRLMVEGIVCNSKGRVSREDMVGDRPEQWTWQKGNQTDRSLMAWMMGYNKLPKMDFIDLDAEREANIFEKSYAFDSNVKRSSVVFKAGAGHRHYFKGASERILAFCSNSANAKGESVPMDEAKKAEVENLINQMASSGLRTLAFAYIDYDNLKMDAETGVLEDPPEPKDATFVGVVGVQDPLRPTTKAAVQKCQLAGIVVRMVTGDHVATARSIAIDCDILTSKDHVVMDGAEFRRMMAGGDESVLTDVIPRLRVLARSEPADKMALVTWLKEHDQIVGATGDGTNDAQALKEANVGIAMNIAGTDVAKQAADIIILDDKFSSVVTAVKWGRSVYDNIRKFVQFQLTVNVVALSLTLIGAWTDFVNPLTAVQLLWINLIMDTMAALALGTEKPMDILLERRPYTPTSSLISRIMIRNIGVQSLYQLVVLLILMYSPQSLGHGRIDGCEGKGVPGIDHGDGEFCYKDEYHYSLIFNVFVWMQIFNEFNSRKCNMEQNICEQLFHNWMFHLIIVFTVIMQFLIIEFFGSFTDTIPLTLNDHLLNIGVCAGCLLIGIPQRMIPVDISDSLIPSLDGQFTADLPEYLARQTDDEKKSN